MKLKSTRNASIDSGIKIAIYGPAGSGKTSLCATTGNPNTLIISAEAGLLSLRDHDIPYLEVTSIGELIDAYNFVTGPDGAEFEWICLDSVSEIAEVVLADEKMRSKDPRQAYGAMMDQMAAIIRNFRDLKGKNVYFSVKQERIKDEQTGAMLYGPSMPGTKLGQSLPYFFDEVFAIRVERDNEGNTSRWLQTAIDPQYYCKDRSGALDMFEHPHLGNILDKIKTSKNVKQEAA